jgi:hypothetical protein
MNEEREKSDSQGLKDETTSQQIRMRAYTLYLERGSPEGMGSAL